MVVHPDEEVLHSNEQDWTMASNNAGESHQQNAGQEKSEVEEHRLYDAIYIKSKLGQDKSVA